MEAQLSCEYGLVVFSQPVQLTPVQQTMAEGYKLIVTIDWGDFKRHHWDQLIKNIVEIKAHSLMLRNNRYQPILRDISHISYPHLTILNLSSNRINSLQILPKLNAPSLKEIQLSQNYIVSTKSLAKSWLPSLEIIRLHQNPLINNEQMFKGYFPKLREFWFDENGTIYETRKSNLWADPAIWRIKNAPILVKQGQMPRGRMPLRHYYGYNPQPQQPKKLTLVKYVQMLRHKPRYFVPAAQ